MTSCHYLILSTFGGWIAWSDDFNLWEFFISNAVNVTGAKASFKNIWMFQCLLTLKMLIWFCRDELDCWFELPIIFTYGAFVPLTWELPNFAQEHYWAEWCAVSSRLFFPSGVHFHLSVLLSHFLILLVPLPARSLCVIYHFAIL